MSTIKKRMNFGSVFPNLLVHGSPLRNERADYQHYSDVHNWRVKLTGNLYVK